MVLALIFVWVDIAAAPTALTQTTPPSAENHRIKILADGAGWLQGLPD